MMKLIRIALSALLPLAPAATLAGEATYPVKNVLVILPYVAGGSADLLGRAVAKGLSDTWGRNFVVDNRPGASGMIGAELAAKAPPDGYTLLIVPRRRIPARWRCAQNCRSIQSRRS